jgi:ATP diphosphatase
MSKAQSTLDELVAVMAALRTPDTGCPWDLEQTFETIAPYTVEEAYEVADAVARADLADLKEELGDLLLQVVYHARLAEEAGAFALPDVVAGITSKMIRRHPHVFGDAAARSAGMAKGFWEAIKAEEKAQRAAERARLGGPVAAGPPSLLADVPVGMPGLTRAVKLQAKAAKVGFDWPHLGPVFDKVEEELGELQAAIAAAGPDDGGERAGSDIEAEFGDLLFVLANVARHLRIDPEAAVRRTNRKFSTRFAAIEAELARRGRTPSDSSLVEMDAIWTEVKRRERG